MKVIVEGVDSASEEDRLSNWTYNTGQSAEVEFSIVKPYKTGYVRIKFADVYVDIKPRDLFAVTAMVKEELRDD